MKLSTNLYGAVALSAFAAAETQFSEYILAPSSRTLTPVSIYQTGGDVQGADALIDAASESSTTFNGANSYVTVDFGKNIGGTVSFNVDSSEGEEEAIGFTFSESNQWISAEYCDATQNEELDLPQWYNLTGPGTYAADKYHQRGGFRYLTVVHNATGGVSISNLTVYWLAAPEMEDPAAYSGYFHSDSDKLNRVWYAGAYTNQLCSIDPTTGNALGVSVAGWEYNSTLSNGTSVLVDGAKRDRLIWPGDIAISGPSIFVSTGSLDPIRNGIEALLNEQQPDGAFPYAGDPFGAYFAAWTNITEFIFSFTYHCHTLNDVYDYYLFTGDVDFVETYWDRYKHGVNYIVQYIDSTGLANVTTPYDWLRVGMGGHNIEANAILYQTLNNAIELAAVVNDTSGVANWTTSAAGIPPAANTLLWDDSVGLYWDNDTRPALWPQDGNAWAVISGIAEAGNHTTVISDSLAARWVRPYGAPAPEGGVTISPFATGFEVQAHYRAGRADRAVELVEFMWADYMLDDPRMTNSSFIEGYSTNGSTHYPAYELTSHVSYAHGWSTGPTSSLSFLAAGITLTSGAGWTWSVAPALGGLESIQAGFETTLGSFAVDWRNGTDGLTGSFVTPEGTSGVFSVAVTSGWTTLSLVGPNCSTETDVTGSSVVTVDGLVGGNYTVSIS